MPTPLIHYDSHCSYLRAFSQTRLCSGPSAFWLWNTAQGPLKNWGRYSISVGTSLEPVWGCIRILLRKACFKGCATFSLNAITERNHRHKEIISNQSFFPVIKSTGCVHLQNVQIIRHTSPNEKKSAHYWSFSFYTSRESVSKFSDLLIQTDSKNTHFDLPGVSFLTL